MRQGTVMGKRYVDQAGSEVFVTKAGIGTLSAGDVPLRLKESTPLPANDQSNAIAPLQKRGRSGRANDQRA
jgi:hypothetical protein